MKMESYQSAETYFVAGRSITDARSRAMRSETLPESPKAAWDSLDYFERYDHAEDFEVFRFEVVEKVTKVDPPYTKETK